MDIHVKSVDMDMDIDVKFHIHGNSGSLSVTKKAQKIPPANRVD